MNLYSSSRSIFIVLIISFSRSWSGSLVMFPIIYWGTRSSISTMIYRRTRSSIFIMIYWRTTSSIFAMVYWGTRSRSIFPWWTRSLFIFSIVSRRTRSLSILPIISGWTRSRSWSLFFIIFKCSGTTFRLYRLISWLN